MVPPRERDQSLDLTRCGRLCGGRASLVAILGHSRMSISVVSIFVFYYFVYIFIFHHPAYRGVRQAHDKWRLSGWSKEYCVQSEAAVGGSSTSGDREHGDEESWKALDLLPRSSIPFRTFASILDSALCCYMFQSGRAESQGREGGPDKVNGNSNATPRAPLLMDRQRHLYFLG